jgi:S-adenosylmethionine:tRNA ribosyltransferase-isomerase
MHLSDFDFDLPPTLIAQHPVHPRDAARLLYVPAESAKAHAHLHISDLATLLHPEDVLVINNSKVIPARLYGKRGEVRIEILLHRLMESQTWEAFARPLKRLKEGQEIIFAPDFSARVEAILADGLVRLRFLQEAESFRQKLEHHGLPPLPPYIKRGISEGPDTEEDRARYQTVYAAHEGSVAAPTAGLHFTEALLKKLADKGVVIAPVTLHVGAGTFQPVKVENIAEHRMHAELAEITQATADKINKAKAAGKRVIAVGTTSARVLETAAADDGTMKAWQGETRIFMTPGYRFKCVDALLTNFHLPKSTLFMLVAAFIGLPQIKTAYAEAMREGYRFYSYGDACFLEKTKS